MPRNGLGTYQLPAGNPVVTGTPISSTVQNNTLSDIASALTTSICTDGQTPMAANLPMASNKLTGLAAGAAAGDSLRFEQLFSQGAETTIASAATTDIGAQNTAFLNVTGTTTITSFGINFNGPRYLRFSGQLQITNSAALATTTGNNIITYAGQIIILIPISTGWLAVPLVQAVGDNRFINGLMNIDQRNNGASQTFTTGAAIAYCIDRWYASCTGANVTGQRSSARGGFTLTGLASNASTLFGQRIESHNVDDLISTNVTAKINISSTSIASVTWNAYSANSIDNFSTKTLISTGTLAITSTPAIYNFSFNSGANAANGIAIEFVTGALLGSQTITYGMAEFESSSVVIIKHRAYGEELILGQQYYNKFVFSTSGWCISTSGVRFGYSFPSMRATPSIVDLGSTIFYGPGGTQGLSSLTVNTSNSSAIDLTMTAAATGLTTNAGSLVIGTHSLLSEL